MKLFFKGFKSGIKEFGSNVGIIVNSILLSVVYFIGIGITSLLAKLFKKHFLDTEQKRDTYWNNLNLKKKPLKEYYRQF